VKLTEEQYLLICLMEECDEVSQRVSKALRFGLDEVQPGQSLMNSERIGVELTDLVTVVDALSKRGVLRKPLPCGFKRAKIRHYMDYARGRGTLA
jgi:hypothetical protein